MDYFNNILLIMKGLERFNAMKMSIIEKLKENKLKVKSTDLTRLQTIVVNFILEGKNWMLPKSEIARQTKSSRVTVDKCYELLEVIYDEILEDENKNIKES